MNRKPTEELEQEHRIIQQVVGGMAVVEKLESDQKFDRRGVFGNNVSDLRRPVCFCRPRRPRGTQFLFPRSMTAVRLSGVSLPSSRRGPEGPLVIMTCNNKGAGTPAVLARGAQLA